VQQKFVSNYCPRYIIYATLAWLHGCKLQVALAMWQLHLHPLAVAVCCGSCTARLAATAQQLWELFRFLWQSILFFTCMGKMQSTKLLVLKLLIIQKKLFIRIVNNTKEFRFQNQLAKTEKVENLSYLFHYL